MTHIKNIWLKIAHFLLNSKSLSLKQSWIFSLPVYSLIFCVIVIAEKTRPAPIQHNILLIILMLLALFFESGVVLLSSLQYLLNIVYLPIEERIDDIIECCQTTQKGIQKLIKKKQNPNLEEIKEIVNTLLRRPSLFGGEVLKRFAILSYFASRLFFAFIATTIGIVCLQPFGQPGCAIFGDISFSLDLMHIIEKSFFLNLVSMPTIGFINMAPKCLPARIMVYIQIFSSFFLIIIGINLLLGTVFENSALAWEGRKEKLCEHIQKLILDTRDD